MKIYKILLTFLMLSSALTINAQELSLDWKQGDVFIYNTYDGNGNLTEIETTTIKNITSANGTTIYEEYGVIVDPNGKPVGLEDEDGHIDNTIENDVSMNANEIAFIDMSNIIGDIGDVEDDGMSISTSGKFPSIPRNPKVGTLPDAEFKFSVKEGIFSLNFKVAYTHRKVDGRERITTPAGEFDCWKITERLSVSVMLIKKHVIYTTWVADKVGIVKQDMMTTKKEMISSQVLCKRK